MKGVSPHYVHAVTRGASELGFCKNELLDKAGITFEQLEDTSTYLTVQQVATLFRAVWQTTGDEFFGLGKRPCTLGFMRMQVLSHSQGSDLESALKYSSEFYRVTREDMSLSITQDGAYAKLTLDIDCADHDKDYLLREYNLVAWQRYASWLIGARLKVHKTNFNYGEPEHSYVYSDIFDGELFYDQEEFGIVFDAKYLNYPIKKSYRDRSKFLKSLPFPVFRLPVIEKPYTGKIRTAWDKEPPDRLSDLEAMSNQLGLPSRTLRRKLKEEETSFQRIKNKYRCDLAVECFTQKKMNVNEASQYLGFSEPAAFCHFFKKEAGLSPSKFLQFNAYL